MAVTTISRNSYTFKGKSSDFHFNTQQNADIFLAENGFVDVTGTKTF